MSKLRFMFIGDNYIKNFNFMHKAFCINYFKQSSNYSGLILSYPQNYAGIIDTCLCS